MDVLQARGGLELPHRSSLYFCAPKHPAQKRVVCTSSPSPALPLTNVPTRTPTHTSTNESSLPGTSPAPAAAPSRTPGRPKLHPWLIVGVGNPGNKFHKTRHNVGFEMIDAIAEAEGIKLNTIQQKALTGKGEIGSTQVLLAKPQTYVNLTGQSVGPLAAYYRIPVQQILVIYDDMDLEFGLMRLATKGGHGSSNGIKSVIENLKGCRSFPRLRIGIGKAPGTMDPGAFVLQSFFKDEREEIDKLLVQGPVLVREMITEGIEKTAEVWNELRKSRMDLTPEELKLVKQLSHNESF